VPALTAHRGAAAPAAGSRQPVLPCRAARRGPFEQPANAASTNGVSRPPPGLEASSLWPSARDRVAAGTEAAATPTPPGRRVGGGARRAARRAGRRIPPSSVALAGHRRVHQANAVEGMSRATDPVGGHVLSTGPALSPRGTQYHQRAATRDTRPPTRRNGSAARLRGRRVPRRRADRSAGGRGTAASRRGPRARHR
jgi:hypothetical protein